MIAELDAEVHHRPAAGMMHGTLALARLHPDIVHVHMTAAELAAWVSQSATRAPVVATRHFARPRGSSPPARIAARLASRSITIEIATSRYVADIVGGRSRVIYHGVPDQPAASLDTSRVVMLQRLEVEKATDVGIRAWAESRLSEDGWRLVVAGEGEQRPKLERLAGDLGVGASVDFVGPVDDTAGLLDGAAAFLAPASVEAFGLSVVEAMAHALPVVAAAGGGHLETVGDVGLLFPPGDARAAGAHLRTLAADPGTRREIGACLRRRQQERFTLVQHLDELESLYRELCPIPVE